MILPHDRQIAAWLADGPHEGPPESLARALAATRRTRKRPRWTFPERWIPMQLTMTRTRSQRPLLAIVMLVLLMVALVAATLAVYVGSQLRRLPEPFGPAGNGVIALAKDGDIFVADRPGGDLRPLVAGPEDDSGPMFSPDGTRLAFLRDGPQGQFLMLADADGMNVVQVTSEPPAMLAFAPDGRSLVGVADIDGKRVVIRPVDPAAAVTVLGIWLGGWSEITTSGGPSFNPTNPQEILVVGHLEEDGPQGVYVYDVATGGIRTVLERADDAWSSDVAWLPDGEHITYNGARLVAADGSGDQALDASLDALRARISPFSNDGTRIVAEHGGDGEKAMVVPINGDGESVVIACGPETDIANQIEPPPDIGCPTDWIWSPDDSMLIGTVPHETSSTYLQADPATGQVTELDWRDVGTPAWQRVAP
jgi:Tol biopolymer transport system component